METILQYRHWQDQDQIIFLNSGILSPPGRNRVLDRGAVLSLVNLGEGILQDLRGRGQALRQGRIMGYWREEPQVLSPRKPILREIWIVHHKTAPRDPVMR